MATDAIQVQDVFQQAMQVGECPLWDPQENALYWIDIPQRTVHRLDPADGVHRSWLLPSEPGSIARNQSGGLIVAMRSGFAQLNTSDGSIAPIAAAPFDTATTRFNDGRCDARGRFWVGTIYEPRDRQLGAMYCLQRGIVTRHWGGVTVSNGLAFSCDSRILYHADTSAHLIRQYDFDLDSGQASNPRLFRQFSSDRCNNSSNNYGGRPDGAAVDSAGAYWCAMYEGGRVLRLAPDGELLQEIRLPLRCPTMIAFGGTDLRTLYITSAAHNRPSAELAAYPLSGHLLALRVDVAGRPEPAYLAE